MAKAKIDEADAVWGKKMIQVSVRFWTNDIAEGEGKIVPGECWDCGVVRLEPNKAHHIQSRPPTPFNSMADLWAKMEAVLTKNGVVMHHGTKSRKLFSEGR